MRTNVHSFSLRQRMFWKIVSIVLFSVLFALAPVSAQTAGTITTVAGNYTLGQGYSGDGGPATSAKLNHPFGVAVDAVGNLYIADTTNNVVRKVTPGGTITTFAGNGKAGYNGDNIPATSANLSSPQGIAIDASGNLYIASGCAIRKVTPGGTITTIAGSSYCNNCYMGGWVMAARRPARGSDNPRALPSMLRATST